MPMNVIQDIEDVARKIEHLIDGDDPYLPVKCPFCGHLVSSTEFAVGLWFVQCAKCKATGPRKVTPLEARDAWNKRA